MGGFELLWDGLVSFASSDAHHVGMAAVALTLCWSGGSKLHRPEAAAWAMVDFKVLRRVRPGSARLLGLAEIVIGAALVAGLTTGGALATVTAGAAAALFGVFTAVIGRSLRRGEAFDCACFGAGPSRLSRLTLLRAAGLCVLAGALATAAAQAGPVGGPSELTLVFVAATAVVALLPMLAALGPLVRLNADPFGRDRRLYESWETT